MSAPVVEQRRPSLARLAGFVVLLTAVSWGLGAFASYPLALSSEEALLTVAFKHVADFEREREKLSREELEKLPRHMRPQNQLRSGVGRRVQSLLAIALDGRALVAKRYRPTGLRENGPTFVYEQLSVPPGVHLVEVTFEDAMSREEEEKEENKRAENGRRQWRLKEELEIRPRQALLVEFSEEAGLTVRSSAER